jgi:hypothetical protein
VFDIFPRIRDDYTNLDDERTAFVHPQQQQSIFSWKNEAIEDRIHDYFGLAGFIYKWTVLYKKLPPMESWVYEAYPDGDFWKEMIKMYGLTAFDEVHK